MADDVYDSEDSDEQYAGSAGTEKHHKWNNWNGNDYEKEIQEMVKEQASVNMAEAYYSENMEEAYHSAYMADSDTLPDLETDSGSSDSDFSDLDQEELDRLELYNSDLDTDGEEEANNAHNVVVPETLALVHNTGEKGHIHSLVGHRIKMNQEDATHHDHIGRVVEVVNKTTVAVDFGGMIMPVSAGCIQLHKEANHAVGYGWDAIGDSELPGHSCQANQSAMGL